EWTSKKAKLLEAFDQSGITAVFMDPEHGGYLVGPKNLALALIAFELAWVDAWPWRQFTSGARRNSARITWRWPLLPHPGRIAIPIAGPSVSPNRFPMLAWIPAC